MTSIRPRLWWLMAVGAFATACAALSLPSQAEAQAPDPSVAPSAPNSATAPKDSPAQPAVMAPPAVAPPDDGVRPADPGPQARPGLRTGQFRLDGMWLPYPRTQQEAFMIYQSYSKNAGVALALELFLPSGGLVYARRYGETGFYWLGMVTGVVSLVSALPGPDPSGELHTGRFALGIGLISVLRIGALIYAPWVTMQYNDALQYHLGIYEGGGQLWPGRAPGAQAPAPRQPEFSALSTADVHLPLLSLRF